MIEGGEKVRWKGRRGLKEGGNCSRKLRGIDAPVYSYSSQYRLVPQDSQLDSTSVEPISGVLTLQ